MKIAFNEEAFLLGSKCDLVPTKSGASQFRIYDVHFSYKDV